MEEMRLLLDMLEDRIEGRKTVEVETDQISELLESPPVEMVGEEMVDTRRWVSEVCVIVLIEWKEYQITMKRLQYLGM